MTAAARARDLVIAVAGERAWGATRASWLRDAARKLGLGYSRCRSIFYGEARLIGKDEWDRLQEKADQLGIFQNNERAEHARLAMDLRAGSPLPGARIDVGWRSDAQAGGKGDGEET